MSASPQLWIVAGPNGAGKTTCTQKEPVASILPKVRFFNPDDMTRTKLQASGYASFADTPDNLLTKLFIESAVEVERLLEESIENNEIVGVETVLSSDKYRRLVDRTIELGGTFWLIYVTLRSPEIAIKRVRNRVARGGHGIPEDKIAARFHRSLSGLSWFCQKASSFWVVDNSDDDPDGMPVLIAKGTDGQLKFLHPEALPALKAALTS